MQSCTCHRRGCCCVRLTDQTRGGLLTTQFLALRVQKLAQIGNGRNGQNQGLLRAKTQKRVTPGCTVLTAQFEIVFSVIFLGIARH